jgi:cell division control protein 6
MKLTDYLHEQAKNIEQRTQRIKDFRVFDFNYIPDEPLMREESKPIVDASLRYLKTGIPNHLFIFGTRGCGKTLMVRYIAKLLTQSHPVQVLYANCRQHNTSFKILAHLLGVRPRGCSLDELFHRFSDQHRGRTILVLDEVDLISDKDRNRDILYLISRSPRNHMLILLSNHPRFLSTLDESVRSTLQPEIIHFRNYDAVELQQILRQRASSGLTEVAEGVVETIAALTVRETNSDVRVAIKTLYYLAVESGTNIDTDTAFHRALRDLTNDVLLNLTDASLLMLSAVTDEREPLVKNVYQRYRHLCSEHRCEPFSYVYFYSNLSYLQSIGLILLTSTKVGRSFTNRVELLFHSAVLRQICESRF